jgi:hypothetical protein
MSTHGKTRLSCRLVRLRDAMTGSRPAGHVAHCADCQAYYRNADSFSEQLRATAPRSPQPVSDELATRIARAVRQSAPAARAPRRTRVLETFAALGTAAAIFAFGIHLVRQNSAPQQSTKDQTIVMNASDLNALVAGVDSLRTRLLDSVEPAAEALTSQNPLNQEIASVQADARSALGFLALNFLPSASAQQIESRIDPTRS